MEYDGLLLNYIAISILLSALAYFALVFIHSVKKGKLFKIGYRIFFILTVILAVSFWHIQKRMVTSIPNADFPSSMEEDNKKDTVSVLSQNERLEKILEIIGSEENKAYPEFHEFVEYIIFDGVIEDREFQAILNINSSKKQKELMALEMQQAKDLKMLSEILYNE